MYNARSLQPQASKDGNNTMETILAIIKQIPKPSAAQIAHFLKMIGKGNMVRGVAVVAAAGAAGGATAGIIATMIAKGKIHDQELKELAEKLKQANELYEAARRVTERQKVEINDLNIKIMEILKSGQKDREQLESLKARLASLIEQLERGK